MRKFIINVNGKSYEVEVEEIRDGMSTAPTTQTAPSEQPAVPVSQPKTAADSKPQPTSSAPENAGSVEVKAPMPGNILDIKVKVGDSLKKGQLVLILEAMKMENEIMAPQDGKISSINTSKGSSVNSGDLLFTMN